MFRRIWSAVKFVFQLHLCSLQRGRLAVGLEWTEERAAADMHTDRRRTDHRTQLLVTAARLNRPGYRLGGAHLQYVDIAAASGRVLLKYESFLMSFITLRRAIMSCPDVSTCKWEFLYTDAIAECPSRRQQWMPAGFQPGFARISPET